LIRHHTPGFSIIHKVLRNLFYMLIWCLRKMSYYYQCWKQLCCVIVLWDIFCGIIFSVFFDEYSLFKIIFIAHFQIYRQIDNTITGQNQTHTQKEKNSFS